MLCTPTNPPRIELPPPVTLPREPLSTMMLPDAGEAAGEAGLSDHDIADRERTADEVGVVEARAIGPARTLAVGIAFADEAAGHGKIARRDVAAGDPTP